MTIFVSLPIKVPRSIPEPASSARIVSRHSTPTKQKRPAEAGRSVIQAKRGLEAPDGDCIHNGLLAGVTFNKDRHNVVGIDRNILGFAVGSFQAQGEL